MHFIALSLSLLFRRFVTLQSAALSSYDCAVYVQQFELQPCRPCLALQVDLTVGRLDAVAVWRDMGRRGCNVLLKALSFNRAVSNRSIRRTLDAGVRTVNAMALTSEQERH
jgi:hypothetical protein